MSVAAVLLLPLSPSSSPPARISDLPVFLNILLDTLSLTPRPALTLAEKDCKAATEDLESDRHFVLSYCLTSNFVYVRPRVRIPSRLLDLRVACLSVRIRRTLRAHRPGKIVAWSPS